MPQNKNAYLRYRVIDQCINNKYRKYNRENLAEVVSEKIGQTISVSTIDKDLKFMKEELDAPIQYHRLDKYYFYDSDFSLTGMVISDEEERSLKASLSILDILKETKFAQKFDGLIQRLVSEMRVRESYVPIEFEQSYVQGGLSWFDFLLESIEKRVALSLMYRSYGKEEQEMTVSPLLLKEYRGRFYLVAHKHEKERKDPIFCLALDRIQNATASKSVYQVNPNFDSKTFFKFSIGITRKLNEDPIKVKLLFNSLSAPFVISKPLHHTQVEVSNNEDGLLIEMEVYQSPELTMQILSFGPNVKVVSPQVLQQEMKEKISQMQTLYLK
jgi:predicted DNA-binding transcriptional regulator YafY